MVTKAMEIKIGILAFQGAFAEHKHCLAKCYEHMKGSGKLAPGHQLDVLEVRTVQDITGLHGLIIPGGESTTMSKFLERGQFVEGLQKWRQGENGTHPVIWGTCAGLILLANNLQEQKTGGQVNLGGLDITASRNLYGRQRESFVTSISITSTEVRDSLLEKDVDSFEGVFIRAPGISSIDSDDIQVLAQGNILKDGTTVCPVAVKQGNLMVTAFHPELTQDYRWHAYFINIVLQHNANM